MSEGRRILGPYAFKAGAALLYAAHTLPIFPGSSVVEQPAVNRLVAGSNPARGASFSVRLATIWFSRTLGFAGLAAWDAVNGHKLALP